MQISKNGLDMIKQFEGFRAIPYKDVVGKLTIGYGHLIKPKEVFTTLSIEQATELLLKDVGFAEDCIANYVKVELGQNQYDALCSFIFNLGCTNFKASTLLRYINACKSELAAAEFGRWNHAGKSIIAGLTKRRAAEAALFEK